MKKENLIQYALLGCIAFIVLIGLVYTFKTSNNLKQAVKNLNDARQKVDESAKILNDQKIIIDSIRSSNSKLLLDIGKMQNGYDQIRQAINTKFINADRSLESINSKLNTLTSYEGPIE